MLSRSLIGAFALAATCLPWGCAPSFTGQEPDAGMGFGWTGTTGTSTTGTGTGTTWTGGGHSGGGGGWGDEFRPLAVGFVFDGVLLADGSMGTYRAENIQSVPPSLTLVVIGEDYFTGDSSQSCVLYSEFDAPLASCDLPNTEGADTWNSYVSQLSLGWEDQTCDGRIDEAALLAIRSAFDGATVGLSFGPMTSYLESAWSADALQLYGHAMSAMYVSIVDGDGRFVGDDWSTAISFQWDPATREIVDPGNGYGIPVVASSSGATLDQAYLRSFPVAYHDLAELDPQHMDDPVDPCAPQDTGATTETAGFHSGGFDSHSGGDTVPEPTDDGPGDTDTPAAEPPGCGCASTGRSAGWVVLAGALAVRRRRRSVRG